MVLIVIPVYHTVLCFGRFGNVFQLFSLDITNGGRHLRVNWMIQVINESTTDVNNPPK